MDPLMSKTFSGSVTNFHFIILVDNCKFLAKLKKFITSSDAAVGKIIYYFYWRVAKQRYIMSLTTLGQSYLILGESANANLPDFIMKYVVYHSPLPLVCPSLYLQFTKYQYSG